MHHCTKMYSPINALNNLTNPALHETVACRKTAKFAPWNDWKASCYEFPGTDQAVEYLQLYRSTAVLIAMWIRTIAITNCNIVQLSFMSSFLTASPTTTKTDSVQTFSHHTSSLHCCRFPIWSALTSLATPFVCSCIYIPLIHLCILLPLSLSRYIAASLWDRKILSASILPPPNQQFNLLART